MRQRSVAHSQFDHAVRSIEEMVRNGSFAPGDKLPSARELCDMMGVSRSILREALRVAESHGLVSVQAGRGIFIREFEVAGINDEVNSLIVSGNIGVDDLILARHFLEPGIAHVAAIRLTDEDISDLEKYLQEMIDNLESGDAFLKADQNFHLTLAKGSNNPILQLMGKILVDCLSVFRKTIYEVEGAPAKAIKRHKDILDAVKARDSQVAYRCMEEHIIDAEEHQRVRLMQSSLEQMSL